MQTHQCKAVHLKNHVRVHTQSGEKPYECKQHGKSFNRAGKLQKHKLLHTGDETCDCKQCGKAFNHGGNLKKQLRVHTLEKVSTDEVPFNYAQIEEHCSLNISITENCSIQPIVKSSNCDIKSNISTATSNFQEPELCHVECWICQEELCSQAQLLKHYDTHMK